MKKTQSGIRPVKSILVSMLLSLFFSFHSYGQCAAVTSTDPDTDGDGVANSVDVDDDNDGIPDTTEGASNCGDGTVRTISWDFEGEKTSAADRAFFTSKGEDFSHPFSRTLAGPGVEIYGGGGSWRLMHIENDGTLADAIAKQEYQYGSFTIGSQGIYITSWLYYQFSNTSVSSSKMPKMGILIDDDADFSSPVVVNDGVAETTPYTTVNTYEKLVYVSHQTYLSPNTKYYVRFYDVAYGTTYNDVTHDQIGLAFEAVPNGVTCGDVDTDRDGIFNRLDLDSDNDGILDVIEANPTGYNVSALGAACRYPDGNNTVNGCEDGSTDYAVDTVKSSDTDGIPDYLDLDSDGDDCPDAVEANIDANVNKDTEEYYITEADSNGLTEAGCTARPQDNQWIDGTPSTRDGCRQKEPRGALPVLFERVGAFISGEMLQVSWATATEKGNDHFEIEVSKDGKTWSKAGSSVSSKAITGDSDISVQYEQSIPLGEIAIMGISLFLLSMGMMFRKNKWLGLASVVIGMSTMVYGCTKETNELSSGEQTIYVRVKQVDKNGLASYSKVVTAVIK